MRSLGTSNSINQPIKLSLLNKEQLTISMRLMNTSWHEHTQYSSQTSLTSRHTLGHSHIIAKCNAEASLPMHGALVMSSCPYITQGEDGKITRQGHVTIQLPRHVSSGALHMTTCIARPGCTADGQVT